MESGVKKIGDVVMNGQPISISKRGDEAKGRSKNSRWQHMNGKKNTYKLLNGKNNKNTTKN